MDAERRCAACERMLTELPSALPHRLQRFTADFRDLTSWVTEMQALINADELANDVAGAEALLDRHQEHKVRPSRTARRVPRREFERSLLPPQGEIDAHEDSFRVTDEAGQALLNTGHYASEEVKEKVGPLFSPSFA